MGQVSTLCKHMCKTRGRYLPAFALWKPFSELRCDTHLQCESHLTMEGKVQQQRVYTDFCFCLGNTGAETYKVLRAAFGESCLS